jgi:DNA-binding response OmpR family regulator
MFDAFAARPLSELLERKVSMVVAARASRLFIVILTEDDGQAQPVTLQLRGHGHEVFVARSEEQATRLLVVHAADVILIDTWLDGEDGFAIADRLCVPMKRRPMLVGIVGRDTGSDRSQTHRFDHRVNKPVNVMILAEILASHANSRGNGARG